MSFRVDTRQLMNDTSHESDILMTLSSNESSHSIYDYTIYLVDLFVPKIPRGQHGCMMH